MAALPGACLPLTTLRTWKRLAVPWMNTVGNRVGIRIMLVAPLWYPVPPVSYGGIEQVVALLAQEFERRGHDVTVVASGGSNPTGTLRSPLATPPDPTLIGNGWYEAYHALSAYADTQGVDIIPRPQRLHLGRDCVAGSVAAAGGAHAPRTLVTRNPGFLSPR
jgi:glycosyltransferase involved in cell wall biosynthesis